MNGAGGDQMPSGLSLTEGVVIPGTCVTADFGFAAVVAGFAFAAGLAVVAGLVVFTASGNFRGGCGIGCGIGCSS